MELNKVQFDILSALAENRNIDLNEDAIFLEENGLINGLKITQKGLDALEPYRVKRAIFLAAGLGERMYPVTKDTPKPLVKVFGVRIIDRLIDALLNVGIDEIIIVRGYLSEQFDLIKDKYPNVKFIENPYFNDSNNITSVLQARDLLENAYVFESDLLLYNPSIIRKYHYSSNFLGIKKEKSDDWCFTLKDGYICEEKLGGNDCIQMVGISYWDEADGKKLFNHIKEACEMPDGNKLYWEQVPLIKFKDSYKVYVNECKEEDIVEIDTFSELIAIDESYK